MTPGETRRDRFWSIVRAIPRGRVATYGQVAALAGFPGHARLVGYALAALPADSKVPWHRVVNARGGISLSPGSHAARAQRALLEAEGVAFHAGCVPLDRYRWRRRSSRAFE